MTKGEIINWIDITNIIISDYFITFPVPGISMKEILEPHRRHKSRERESERETNRFVINGLNFSGPETSMKQNLKPQERAQI